MTQNLTSKKLQIVRDTIESERFLELLGLHIGAYKDLKIDVLSNSMTIQLSHFISIV